MKYVEIASAIVMILSGLYLTWYWFIEIRDKYGDNLTDRELNWQERIVDFIDNNLTDRVLNWQGRIQQFIDNNRLVLALIFAVIVGSALTYTFVSRRRDLERSS